jgi:hypothetical protein
MIAVLSIQNALGKTVGLRRSEDEGKGTLDSIMVWLRHPRKARKQSSPFVFRIDENARSIAASFLVIPAVCS